MVASAAATLGVPMLEAERQQVQQLATTIRDLRQQRQRLDRKFRDRLLKIGLGGEST